MTAPQKPTPKETSDPLKSPPLFRWWYLFLAVFLIGQLANSFFFSPEKTDWQVFNQEMLATTAVEKLEVVNKEWVEVYIKKDFLGKDVFEDIRSGHPGPHYYFTIGSIEMFEQKLADAEQKYSLAEPLTITYINRTNWIGQLLSWTIPLLILIAFWYFIMMRITPGRGRMNPFDFGKSKGEIVNQQGKIKIRFSDVAGLESAKVEVKEIVDFLQRPEFYTRLGAKIPKGLILVGPPGTGKTLLAKAVAGEANVPFYSLSGSEFVEMFVGVGASRVRDLFKKAKASAPCIIFIDEIDAVGRSRSSLRSFNSNDERESTLNQLLAELDGFDDNAGVIVMAATNRPDILDKALLRPGRFDRHVYLELPNLQERIAIFKVHTKKLKLSEALNVETLAAQVPGFSGADIANVSNEAALIAARKQKEAIDPEDFSAAIDRIVGGLERKGKIISAKEKKIIAYHEAGHATASWFLENADELMKVTIIPRGKSLGATWFKAEEQQLFTKNQLDDRLCVGLGGRAAEELAFGEVSTGALDDLEKVTKQAYRMVKELGLSTVLGHVSYFDSTGEYQQSLQKVYSEATSELIDKEVAQMVQHSYERTKKILQEYWKELDTLAQMLLEKEVVEEEELRQILGGRVSQKPSESVNQKYQNNEAR